MAFPQVAGSATTNGTVATLSASVNLPTGIQAGDLLLCLLRSAATNQYSFPSGWNELFDASPDSSTDGSVLAWKKADGTEGSTVTVNFSSNSRVFAAITWRITGAANPVTTPPQISTVAVGTDTAPDPTSLAPTGGAKDYLWLWVGTWEGEQTSPPASNPSGFTSNILGADSGTAGADTTNCRVASASREENTASKDPGSWTISAAGSWLAYTVAIHPPNYQEADAAAVGAAVVAGVGASVFAGVGASVGAAVALGVGTYVHVPATQKLDTRLHVALESGIETDLSQWEQDLTLSGDGAYEEGASRLGITTRRCIELVADLNASSSGTLVDCGSDLGDPPYRVRVSGGGFAFMSGGTTETLDLPAGADRFLIVWATEPNPLTTGPSDAVRSEARIYGLTTELLSRTTWSHEDPEPDEDDSHFALGGVWDGATLSDPLTDGVLQECRIGARFHHAVESREDFVAQTSVPTVVGYRLTEAPRLAPAAFDLDEFAGPAYQAPAVANAANSLRLCSPLVWSIWRDPPTLQADLRETWSAKWVIDLILEDKQTAAPWLWIRPIPRHLGWVVCRVQLAVWSDDVDPPGTVELAFTCGTHRPNEGGERNSVTLTRSTDDGEEGAGVVLEFDPCRVERAEDGWTWLWLSAEITGVNAADTRYMIRAIHVTALARPSSDADDNAPEEWGP